MVTMSSTTTLDQALALLKQYNQEEFHIRHARIVSGVLGYFAEEYDPENREFWEIVGLLHDLDFEKYPDQHCIKSQEIMRKHDLDERLVRAVASHGYNITVDIKPEYIMEKILYAVDELTGLIGAVAIMRPSRSVSDLPLKSVMKKFKTANFAAGCSRKVITDGADMLGWTVDDLISRTILAMRSLSNRMEI
jgi:predicted hydrolase (HD superfamily)